MLAMTLIESGWWLASWMSGAAPAPFLFTYLFVAFAGLAGALVLRSATRRRLTDTPWPAIAVGVVLVAVGASFFLPLKFAIPSEVPFWLDQPLASAERATFGADPWLILDRLLGWAILPIDRVYALWLPLQTVALFSVMIARPSPAKSRALIAYSLAWFVLGVAAAAILASAGPLFYDRLFGGSEFAGLGESLRAHGAIVSLSESDAMWASLASDRPGLVAGISAMPSIHVAISFWMVQTARTMAPRLTWAAVAYAFLIWIGSVQLGWHYVSDGVVGALGMAGLWAASGPLDRALARILGNH